jgi:hypothetical protein
MSIRLIIRTVMAGCVCVAAGLTIWDARPAPAASVPNVVTADIQEGIERHIAEQTRRGRGYFRLPFKDGE